MSHPLRVPTAVFAALLSLLLASPVASAQPARPADAFVDSVGVNTKLHYSGSPYDAGFDAFVAPKLLASNIRHVRDTAYTYAAAGPDTIFNRRCRRLAAGGMRFTFTTSLGVTGPEPTDYGRLGDVSDWCAGAVAAFEGVNEPDLEPISDWAWRTQQSQAALYRAVKADPRIRDVPVIGPAITWQPGAVGDLSGQLDYGNWHPFPGGDCPTCGNVYGDNLDTRVGGYRAPSADKPMTATETGYHNAVNSERSPHRPVSERAAGKYVPRLLLEYFNRGYVRTYLHELVDAWQDDSRSNEHGNFGLLRNDGSEKPAYRALQSLLGLLADPGSSFAPDDLGYRLSGDTERVHSTLLQKRDGRFFLALWLERPSYDTGARPNAPDDLGARGDRSPASQRVTVALDRSVRSAALHRIDDDGGLASAEVGADGGRVALGADGGRVALDVTDGVSVLELASARR